MSLDSVAAIIDHTLLKAFSTDSDIRKLCDEANKYHFASVCVNPIYVGLASQYLKSLNSDVKICTVIGFPLGSSTTETKVFETENAIMNGANEIDMVIAIGKLKAGEYDYVKDEIKRIHDVCAQHDCILKDEIIKASELTFEGGAEFVKTSTGFGTSSATVEAVSAMSNVAKRYGGKVKAAGGVRSYADALKMIDAGAYLFDYSFFFSVTPMID